MGAGWGGAYNTRQLCVVPVGPWSNAPNSRALEKGHGLRVEARGAWMGGRGRAGAAEAEKWAGDGFGRLRTGTHTVTGTRPSLVDLPQPPVDTQFISCTPEEISRSSFSLHLSKYRHNDQGSSRQASRRAEEAMGQQAPAPLPVPQPCHDRFQRSHDLEGAHVCYQGRFW